jgi:hypothetical protein
LELREGKGKRTDEISPEDCSQIASLLQSACHTNTNEISFKRKQL